jgi:chromosome segregation ATPase
LSTFGNYLRKARADLKKAFPRASSSDLRVQQFERDLLSLTVENQTLAAKLEQLTAELERERSESLHRSEFLEHAQRDTEAARATDAGSMRKLEQSLATAEAQRAQEHEQIVALKTLLDETRTRMETRDNQLKFLQDSAHERLERLKTSLAETASRLETRDNELRRLLETTRERIVAIENALEETGRRFETLEGGTGELRSRLGEQTRQLDAGLSSTNTLFESMNNQIQTLQKKLDIEHKLQQNLFQDTQMQLRRQHSRFNRTLAAAGLVLALALLFWLTH